MIKKFKNNVSPLYNDACTYVSGNKSIVTSV